MKRTHGHRNGPLVSLPSRHREISKLKERNETPPVTPVGRNRASGIENRPPKVLEKRSREERIPKQDHKTKKRITYKKDNTVKTINFRGSDDLYCAVQEEAEEEDEQSISEKTDGEEDKAMSDEGSDSETSGGDSRDADEADDDEERSSDDTAQDEDDEEADEDGRVAEKREISPSLKRTRCTSERLQNKERDACDTAPNDRQLVRKDNEIQEGKQSVVKLLPLQKVAVIRTEYAGISMMRGSYCALFTELSIFTVMKLDAIFGVFNIIFAF
ncbi:hypothetical protein CBR_g5691 [Chara braunii]|uniref:Uncharacterized protein n=1 Tax=Chara braunii TaxID=69332 RepID=A0A388JRV1_CHABU|nr:hypothetical protein CBR_g5691 [Chara braunii]|eukprot:GBG60515.1 hypothetical protein CBR_g5691 [Chara braunii]